MLSFLAHWRHGRLEQKIFSGIFCRNVFVGCCTLIGDSHHFPLADFLAEHMCGELTCTCGSHWGALTSWVEEQHRALDDVEISTHETFFAMVRDRMVEVSVEFTPLPEGKDENYTYESEKQRFKVGDDESAAFPHAHAHTHTHAHAHRHTHTHTHTHTHEQAQAVPHHNDDTSSHNRIC
jgi:hypothetical protein